MGKDQGEEGGRGEKNRVGSEEEKTGMEGAGGDKAYDERVD